MLGAVQNTVGIPVAQMDDAYSKETLALAEAVDKYASMDLYNAERPKLVGVSACPGISSVSARPLSGNGMQMQLVVQSGHRSGNLME